MASVGGLARSWGRRAIFSGAVTVALLVVLELLLWLLAPLADPSSGTQERFHRFLPHSRHVGSPPDDFVFEPGSIPGVDPGPRSVVLNRYAFLYPESKAVRTSDGEVRIAVIGGSTVECIALTPEKRWPAALEALLRDEWPDRPVSVLNMGVSAQDTTGHLATVSHHAVDLDLDCVVFMLGANDLWRASAGAHPMLDDRCFYPSPTLRDHARWLVTRTQMGRRARDMLRRGPAGPPGDEPYFAGIHRERAGRPLLPFEPRLSGAALEGYRRNIVSLAAICRAHGIQVLFATHPMLWKDSPSLEEQQTFWLLSFWHESRFYRVEAGAAARLLETLNEQLLDVCRARGYASADVASLVPRTLEYLYDDVHLTNRGAATVADCVKDAIIASRLCGPAHARGQERRGDNGP